MQEFPVIERIKELCEARSWTYYRLAKESGIAYSTLNTMLNKTMSPSIPTLEKICLGFGITMSQFFSDQDDSIFLSEDDREHLAVWTQLNIHGKELATSYISGLLDMQKAKN